MAHRYTLSVTAGPSYSPTSQSPVPINTETPTTFTSTLGQISLTIRVQNYRPHIPGSPSTSPYFSGDPHKRDLYSLQFSFVPSKDINGSELVLGNDFDYPIRDRLPPGFDQALKIVQWFIDPGLMGDVRGDKPYMYGPMLSSVDTFRIDGLESGSRKEAGVAASAEVQSEQTQPGHGEVESATSSSFKSESDDEKVEIVEEGARSDNNDGEDGKTMRDKSGMPSTASGRKKHFLSADNLKKFTFQKDVRYSCDFFNPYLDFNDFALKLPGFGVIPGITIPVIKYWDGQPLRYVLKNRTTDETLFVVVFTLIPKDPKDEVKIQSATENRDANSGKAAQTGGPAESIEMNDDDVD